MSSIIYYFSGRGNSYRIARDLCERLGDAEIRFMGKQDIDRVDKDADCIGIVTPVIDFGIPAYVKKFIKALKLESRPYVFSVVTYGGMPCGSALQLQKCIEARGLKQGAGFAVKFGLEQYSEADWKSLLDKISSTIRSRSVIPMEKTAVKDILLTSLLNPIARLMIPREDKKFRVSEACNGCGVCARVCPAGNIKMADKRPVWLHKCEQCAACFAWCPKEAVYGANLAARTRYSNPHVTLKQIMNE